MNLPDRGDLDGSSVGFNQGMFKTAIGNLRDYLNDFFGNDTDPLRTVHETFRLNGPHVLNNLSLVFSVAGNALTCALKTRAGVDGSTTNPILATMRDAVLGAGDCLLRSATAATSLIISSGSTLGHANATEGLIYWYLLDNAGTLELAASSKFYGLFGRTSTTAEGGAGTADSGTVMYSANARANVPFRLIAMTRDTQVNAGVWLAVPTQVNLGQLTPVEYGEFDTGTRMIFQQTAAPLGWTKETSSTYNDAALRFTTGTVGTGGTDAFSTHFGTGLNTGNHTLTSAESAVHAHGVNDSGHNHGTTSATLFSSGIVLLGTNGDTQAIHDGTRETTVDASGISIQNSGSGGAHSHPLSNFNIKFADSIIATKN